MDTSSSFEETYLYLPHSGSFLPIDSELLVRGIKTDSSDLYFWTSDTLVSTVLVRFNFFINDDSFVDDKKYFFVRIVDKCTYADITAIENIPILLLVSDD